MKPTPKLLEFKWSVSRGRDTAGYNICTLYVDGKKVSSCNGGGYDMKGTALADYIEAAYQDRLVRIASRANTTYSKEKQLVRSEKPNRLYGMYAYAKDTKKPRRVTIDGACGMSSVEAIMKVIGLTIQYKTDTAYILTDRRDVKPDA